MDLFSLFQIKNEMFFSFDGIDGAGKSTQIDLFSKWLTREGHTVTLCRDPGGTGIGEAIRALLLGQEGPDFGARCEMLLFMASRAQLVEEVILPAQKRNETVISDRFVLANIAYQGFGGRLEVEQIASVAEVATAGVLPDLTFVLDVDWETAQQRLASTPDRMEARGAEYFERVRTGFLSYSKQAPDRFAIIDARSSAESIHDQIVSVASDHLSRLA